MNKKILLIPALIFCLFIFGGFRSCAFTGEVVDLRFWWELDQKLIGHIEDNILIQEPYGIIVGDSGAVATSDGRLPAAWITRQSGTLQRLYRIKIHLNPDSTSAFASGSRSTVIYSTDKGHSWVDLSIPNSGTNLYGLDVMQYSSSSRLHAIVCGDSGKVWRSQNNGSNFVWVSYNVGVNRRLNSIITVSSNVYMAVGEHGGIFKTLTSGQTWENVGPADTTTLNDIASPHFDRFCAVGNNGKIYLSTNYGISWMLRNSNTTNNLRDIKFSGIDTGVAVGDNGTVLFTTDGGMTWLSNEILSGLTTRNIISVALVDSTTINSITRGGVTENSTDTTFFLSVSSEPFSGIEPISNFIAEVFGLKQNYPNPFNPVTNIEISVPQKSQVKLVIYDIGGREIETLINSELSAGAYKIDWNAANYPSGVYFYKLIVVDPSPGHSGLELGFTGTKKMVLVK